MKVFVDTAELNEVEKAESWGIADGVTTNPSLIKKAVEARDEIEMEDYIKSLCESVDGPVSLEVIGVTAEDMVQEGRTLYEGFNPVNENVAIKIPVNPYSEKTEVNDYGGLKAIKELSEMGIPVNTTLVMKPEQALLAARAGAKYVSPFAGRIDDYIRSNLGLSRGDDFAKWDYHDPNLLEKSNESKLESLREELKDKDLKSIYMSEDLREARSQSHDNGIRSGVHLIKSIKEIFDNYDEIGTEVIAASMRNPRQVREAALAGAEIATIPFNVIKEMLKHYKTEKGIDSFAQDVVPEYEELFE